MNNFEKMKKYLISDFIFMLVINAYFVIDSILEVSLLGTGSSNLITSLLSVLLLIAGIIFSKKGENTGGIIGIVVGVLMILGGALINVLLGIFMTIHSITYLIKKNK